MGDPSYELVVDAVSRRKLAAHPAERQRARDQQIYRLTRVFVELAPALALRDQITAAGAYQTRVDRVTDVSSVTYVVRAW